MIVIRWISDIYHLCKIKIIIAMKTILVPTDFSKHANDALDYAMELSRKMKASVHVVHIIEQKGIDNFNAFTDGYGGIELDNVFMLTLIERSKEQLAELASKYDIETEIKLTTSVTSEIIDYSEKIKADLVVMGSKGTNTLDEEIIGSNTEKIVRNAICPILTIKEKGGDSSIQNMVFASDFKDVNSRVMEKIKYFQKLFDSKLHLLRVSTPHNFEDTSSIESKMKETIEKFELENYTTNIYNDFYEEDGIANFASHHNYDLICLATSGRTGMSHFFTGSIAEDVVNHSYKPVMTFNLKTINE